MKAMLKVDTAVFEGDGAEQLSPSDAADLLHDPKRLGGVDNELVKHISSILGDEQDRTFCCFQMLNCLRCLLRLSCIQSYRVLVFSCDAFVLLDCCRLHVFEIIMPTS